ncbi:DUF6262 family protein [Pseudarthrobacter sp. H3Y2-7]|uniref:DUF6262 family protein n=1 Tax=Pseudarthrobacter naphthalenicus TaxID=3031328 RepID=UPI0023AEF1FF|nr:DUF6262 family protein [Pseudarthrobacter sp. H3Y2-7]MDE8671097.1 DUF6262 family protein [Pseudarthrobacter sp. H3Y2-7]
MTSDRTTNLAAATRRRVTETRARARAALRRLDREGAVINYVTVAKAAGVSRALLYRDRELREEIDNLRDRTPTTAPRQPASQRMSQASRDELLAALRTAIHDLRTENHALRTRLAAVLGEERHAAQLPSP